MRHLMFLTWLWTRGGRLGRLTVILFFAIFAILLYSVMR
jgi:hypothetical protein